MESTVPSRKPIANSYKYVETLLTSLQGRFRTSFSFSLCCDLSYSNKNGAECALNCDIASDLERLQASALPSSEKSLVSTANMFDVNFCYASATALPPNLSIDEAISILHSFETVIKLSPDCRGCKQIPPPKNGSPISKGGTPANPMTFYEVEDDLPFIPKRLWSGGVRYNADFTPVSDGCDITVHAPGGFTSTNHWRLLRETAPLTPTLKHPSNITNIEHPETIPEDELKEALVRVQTKDLLHADTESDGAGWYVEIISDAKCPRVYAGFVKGFLKNSHAQLQHSFIDRLKVDSAEKMKKRETPELKRPEMKKRPTLSRRRSSVL